MLNIMVNTDTMTDENNNDDKMSFGTTKVKFYCKSMCGGDSLMSSNLNDGDIKYLFNSIINLNYNSRTTLSEYNSNDIDESLYLMVTFDDYSKLDYARVSVNMAYNYFKRQHVITDQFDSEHSRNIICDLSIIDNNNIETHTMKDIIITDYKLIYADSFTDKNILPSKYCDCNLFKIFDFNNENNFGTDINDVGLLIHIKLNNHVIINKTTDSYGKQRSK